MLSSFSGLESHTDYLQKLKKISRSDKNVKDLVEEWVKRFDSLRRVDAFNVSYTLNILSKLHIFDRKWERNAQENFKRLIVKLLEKGNFIAAEFNSQEIANSLNALSKWNIKQFKGANEFIIKLIEQGNKQIESFNSQDIANSLNALSKWDIKQFKGANEFIIKLIEQGNKQIESFNSQDIANSLNALSKWNIKQFKGANEFIIKLVSQGNKQIKSFNSRDITNSLNALSKWDIEELKGANEFIIKLIEQGNKQIKSFNPQEIANSLNALSKWDIKQFKGANEFIVKLVNQGNQPIKNFNSQEIANSLNALSKWDIEELKGANEFIVKLVNQGNQPIKSFNPQEIANSLNALSKWDIEELKGANEFIIKLIEQGNQTIKSFNSQHIANSLNALSKWDIKQFKGANEFIIKLVNQGNQPIKSFNSQEIANSLNALSKWDIEELKGANKFIIKLIEQGNQPIKNFNSQEIANSLNALSKWDIEELKGANEFVVKLVNQESEPAKKFSFQHIANSYDALYKFNVFDNKKWNDDQLKSIKNFIVKLAEEGKEIYREFDSQGVANTFNAFSRLDILDDSKWTSEEQSKLKFLIVNLVGVNEAYKRYNLKHISKTYKALCKWDISSRKGKYSSKFTDNQFKALVTNLEDRVYTIAKEQDLIEPDIDIRFASQIVKDLPELKSKNLITSESELLIPLMQCLSTSVNSSKVNNLKDSSSKKNILSGLQAFYEIVSKIGNRSSLEGVFDKDLSKIYNKLMEVKVSYANKVLEEINKLDKLGIIKDGKLLGKFERFTVESRVGNENYNKTCDKQIPASNLNYNVRKKNVDDQLPITKDLSNQGIEASGVNSLQDNEMDCTEGGFISVVNGKLSSLLNFVKGYFSQAIPPYEQTTDTEYSQPFKAVEDKIIEAVKQVILEKKISRKLDIDFEKMKKKVVKRFKQGKFDGISQSIESSIFSRCPCLETKFETDEFSQQLDKKINPLIQEVSKNGNSMLEVNDVREQQSLEPQSYLSNVSVQGHLTQDAKLMLM